jgi:DNA primase large subunit
VALIAPEYIAVLDPFSREGKELVKTSPPFEKLPQKIVRRAVERVQWKSGREMIVDFNLEAIRQEVLSFYLACQGVASVSYPYSRETRLLSDATREAIKYRMYDLFKRGHEDLCLKAVQRSFKFLQLERGNGARLGNIEIPKEDFFKLRDRRLAEDGVEIVDDRVLTQYIPKYAVRWTDLAPLLKHRRAELTKLYLINGWAIITPKELWDFFANFVSVKTEEYITSVYERFSDVGAPSKLLSNVGERIASLLPPEVELRERFVRLPTRRLKPEFFPPCIKKALAGVGSGARNYAITVLLTSFLSYARVSPSGKAVLRIADFIEDISIVRDEVAPLIFEAAERCNPPLFKDQPQEKANIFYHLGFGMVTEPRLEDSGKSKWYRTPNCRKIQIAAPALCDPDELCRTIKNPLTYYYRRMSERAGLRGD